MRFPIYFLTLVMISGMLLSSCQPSESTIQTAIAETQFAQQSLTPESSPTPTNTFTPTNTYAPTSIYTLTITQSPTITFTPTITLTPTETSTPTMTPTKTPTIGIGYKCGKYFTITVLEPPNFLSVIGNSSPEYAAGIFMIVKVRFENETERPLWVWFNNYYIRYEVDGNSGSLNIDQSASNVLETRYGNPYQKEIYPNSIYDTQVVFDVNPNGENWTFVVQPEQLCRVTIPLIDNRD